MNELSLFSGAGGGLLATKHLLGWRTIGYVEVEDYCQRVIRQRIEDGYLDNAPIFGDIKAFNREWYAERYRGMVDVVTGGFPCQDISCAGTGKGLDGERSGLWFEMAETIRLVRPRYVFVENSPKILVRGFDRVAGSLSEMGYDCQWGIISAKSIGCYTERKRFWCVARNDKGFSLSAKSKTTIKRVAPEIKFRDTDTCHRIQAVCMHFETTFNESFGVDNAMAYKMG